MDRDSRRTLRSPLYFAALGVCLSVLESSSNVWTLVSGGVSRKFWFAKEKKKMPALGQVHSLLFLYHFPPDSLPYSNRKISPTRQSLLDFQYYPGDIITGIFDAKNCTLPKASHGQWDIPKRKINDCALDQLHYCLNTWDCWVRSRNQSDIRRKLDFCADPLS